MKLSREFVASWPAVLVEMRDFVDLARLFTGGDYTIMAVRVVISKTAPAEWLSTASFKEFRAAIEAVPGIRAGFHAAERPAHRVDIEIQR